MVVGSTHWGILTGLARAGSVGTVLRELEVAGTDACTCGRTGDGDSGGSVLQLLGRLEAGEYNVRPAAQFGDRGPVGICDGVGWRTCQASLE
jgi:hypothetical protein